ncbi:hypothetical protein E4U54_005150, partial [Claviceps lovelessii]
MFTPSRSKNAHMAAFGDGRPDARSEQRGCLCIAVHQRHDMSFSALDFGTMGKARAGFMAHRRAHYVGFSWGPVLASG